MNLRWDPYVMQRDDELPAYWQNAHARDGCRFLYVMGRGFDPRMCVGVESLVSSVENLELNVLEVTFDEGPDSPSDQYADLVEQNSAELRALVPEERIEVRKIPMWSDETLSRRRVGSQQAAQVFPMSPSITGYDHIVIDISALPRSIYFTLTAKVIFLRDALVGDAQKCPRVHLLVSENPEVDSRIRAVGLDDRAYFLHGFSGRLGLESTADIPVLWIPVLGEGEEVRYQRIYELVSPDEVCPVLPWPALDPRRPDRLFEEFLDVLVDRWPIDLRNLIHAAERNPFDLYRSIHSTVGHYQTAMKPLGGCKTALSALSSKLLSVGVLLAAYELKAAGVDVGLAHLDAQGHELGTDPADRSSVIAESSLFVMSVA